MSRQNTSENAINQIGNRYELVLIASKRARELKRGDATKLSKSTNKTCITALEEIEQGLITRDYLTK